MFHLDHIDLVSQLIDGNFPDYTQIIPKKKETRTVVGSGGTAQGVQGRQRVCARERQHCQADASSRAAELAPGHITVQATSAETGDNVGEMDATVEGAPIQIAFNVKYLIDLLSAANAAQVALETTTPSSPGKFTPVGDDSFLCVVMPMHIGNR